MNIIKNINDLPGAPKPPFILVTNKTGHKKEDLKFTEIVKFVRSKTNKNYYCEIWDFFNSNEIFINFYEKSNIIKKDQHSSFLIILDYYNDIFEKYLSFLASKEVSTQDTQKIRERLNDKPVYFTEDEFYSIFCDKRLVPEDIKEFAEKTLNQWISSKLEQKININIDINNKNSKKIISKI